jgi:predicted nucleotide-binding protein (sugar kinase/HSP70/actin superfamily)
MSHIEHESQIAEDAVSEFAPEDVLTQEMRDRLEQQLAEFAEQEAQKLGLGRDQYTENVNTSFTAEQRPHTTILVRGLTLAHDDLIAAALRGLGYKAELMDTPDNEALQYGKEFGNRGQCSPTYFTVGNLVKTLVRMRDEQNIPTETILNDYIFVTAGACGPCRFGTYVTEYRKALRDSGFDGFRVMLFQQQGGVKQATGTELGLQINLDFALGLVRGIMAGDTLNLLGYRLRPYEVETGSTDQAMVECKDILREAFACQGSIVKALVRCRRRMGKVKVDRTHPKPKVSVIGEFWAMTTEGDGNYKIQRFLEAEGAEVDVQSVTAWILFMIWENKYDTTQRLDLREHDDARKGLKGKDGAKKLMILSALDRVVRSVFQLYANTIGLHGYHLPNLDEIAELARPSYGNDVRGGEAHMEVGKLIHFVEDKLNHMTLSVKPFGCMPSSGVSDGVQSLISSQYPEAIFLPIETTGDGAVNVYSRVQMMLFKARQKAKEEYEAALAEMGMDEETFRKRMNGSRRFSRSLWSPSHKVAGTAANFVYAVGR